MIKRMHEVVTIIAKYFIVFSAAGLGLAFFRIEKKRRLDFLLLLVLSAVLTVLLVKLATSVHQDPRPFIRDGVHPYFTSSTDNGFPSDHTAFSALIAFVVLRFSKKLGIVLLVLSSLIGSSRVIAGVHHTQDILGGFIIAGMAVGAGFLILQGIHKLQLKQNS